jgi:hypothetical protein
LTSAQGKLWAELKALDSGRVAARAAVSVEAAGQGESNGTGRRRGGAVYLVRFMDRVYRVAPREEKICGVVPDPELELLLLYYLIHAKEEEAEGRWVSEKELAGGSLFFQGVHALPVQPLIGRFGRDAAGFRRVCAGLQGDALEFGDAAFSFPALPRVPVGLVLWEADVEFPARVTGLFDASLSVHFPPDMVLALVSCVVARIVEAAG